MLLSRRQKDELATISELILSHSNAGVNKLLRLPQLLPLSRTELSSNRRLKVLP